MAQPNLERFTRRSLLLKPQPTAGVDPVPTPALDGIRLFNGSSSTAFDTVERPTDRDFLGHNEFGVANTRAMIEGDFELYPPTTPGQVATSDADAARILLPAGMAVTKDAGNKITRYSPISANFPMAAAYWYHANTFLKALNARATLASLGMEIGQRYTGRATIQGDYEVELMGSPGSAVIIPNRKPVIATHRNSVCLVSTLTGGAIPSAPSTLLEDLPTWSKYLRIDLGAQLTKDEFTEHSENSYGNRQPTFSWRVAKTDVDADFNPLYVRDMGTIVQITWFTYVDDTKDGLYSMQTVRGQIENIANADINGKAGWDITGRCIPSDAGGDEFGIEFGDAAP